MRLGNAVHALVSVWQALLAWLASLLARSRSSLAAARRAWTIVVRPQDPNNHFAVAESDGVGHQVSHGARALDMSGLTRREGATGGVLVYSADPGAMARYRQLAARTLNLGRIEAGTQGANREAAHWDLMRREIRALQAEDLAHLAEVVARLSRRWLDSRQEFKPLERRQRLDVKQTLAHNIGRYGGHILDFRWPVKERLVYQWSKPAKLLVIGDVSRSMSTYCSIVLYLCHLLGSRFPVESFVFSEKSTRATPYFHAAGTFAQKMEALATHAASWDRGTRFGSSLSDILSRAPLDDRTYAIIATDGKVVLHHGEYELVERNLAELRRRVRKVIFVTPSLALAEHKEPPGGVKPVGSFQAGLVEIPIYNLSDLWYNTFAKYADQIFYCHTVGDLVNMVQFLVGEAKSFSFNRLG